MKLYSYWASSAAYRVRIALNLKGIAHETQFVSLVSGGGEHLLPAYQNANPQGLVPALETGEGVLGQSMAILEYLEETHPTPALLPADAFERARVRSFALYVACDIHPVNNLRIRKYLGSELNQSEEAVETWYRHWIEIGFQALETSVSGEPGPFCFGAHPSLADVCLVPQVFNARRFGVDLAPFARLREADAAANALSAFSEAAPAKQADAPAA